MKFVPSEKEKALANVIRRLTDEKPMLYFQQMNWDDDHWVWSGPEIALFSLINQITKNHNPYYTEIYREELTDIRRMMRDPKSNFIRHMSIRSHIWIEPYIEKIVIYNLSFPTDKFIYFSYHPWDEELYISTDLYKKVYYSKPQPFSA